MVINYLQVTSFKAFNSISLSFSNSINIIVGPNAVGKSSVLDSINYLLLRRTCDFVSGSELIHDLDDESVISGTFFEKINKKKRIVLISKYGQKQSIDGLEIKKMSEFVDDIGVVSYNSHDIVDVVGTPSSKRKMIDVIVCQFDQTYSQALSFYKRIIKEKNALLKNDGKPDVTLFNALTEKQFAIYEIIQSKRKEFVNLINEELIGIHPKISSNNEIGTIEYIPSFDTKVGYDGFRQVCEKDLVLKTCTCGCHRDNYLFKLDGHDIFERASQGQIKSLVLSYKMACSKIIEKKKKIIPILLFDDVFGELDKDRQNSLIRLVNESCNQVFITTPSLTDLDKKLLDNANVIHLNKGGVTNGH